MKIALGQINTTIGDFEGNVARMIRMMGVAKKRGARLILFPELAVFGYPPRDLLDRGHLIEANLRAAADVARKTTKDFGCIFGFVRKNESPVGRGLFNAAAFAYGGKIRFVQPKTLLPTYDVFDEARHFDPGVVHHPHPFLGRNWGITLCEDIWFDYRFRGRQFYAVDPISLLKQNGADVIVNISASPFSARKRADRNKILMEEAGQQRVPILYCNLVGGNDELVFDGESLAVNAEGKIVAEGRAFREDLVLVDLEKDKPQARKAIPEIEAIYEALLLGLRDYMAKCGFAKAVVGLSGGIDSSVVATLAADALGPKNVTGISMPSPYSSEGSVKDARLLARRLGIGFRVVPIDAIYLEYLKSLRLDIRKGVDRAAENAQARIRGNILMGVSNKTGALVLSTGNKSELACGYCTLYGDMSGGLGLISDLPKTDVYRLARWLNRKSPRIPPAILKKAPSAELKPNQTDQDTLPPYPVLDAILREYIEEHRDIASIVAGGFSKKLVRRVAAMVDGNEYKRRQAPPGIRVTSKAFGIGRRLPIAWAYDGFS